jgi:hypothetical protein
VESDFDYSGGASGSWWDGLANITGKILDYKTATAPNAVRWFPYGAMGGGQYGVGANGELIQRGVPAPSSTGLGNLQSLLPLGLLALVAVLLFRALK